MNKIYTNNRNSGQALMFTVIFLFSVSLMVVSGLVFSSLSGSKLSIDLINSKKSYFLAESGTEDIIYRVIGAKNYSSEEIIELDGFFATTTINDISENVEITTSADVKENIRKTGISLTIDTGISFHYGVQVGEGGVIMTNSSSITGNLYSNGSVVSNNFNEIIGDAVSATSSGYVEGIRTTGSVYANEIIDSYIEEDAYYQYISNTTVLGSHYPNSPSQSYSDLPITDETIDLWKSIATSTIINSPCPYEIKSDTTLGSTKIACDLKITGSPIITLTGPVWVEGDVLIKNTATIKVDSSLGKKSIPIIADSPSNRLSGSKIELENSVVFENSGTEGSYVLIISQNNSAENGGSEKAIHIKNTVSGDLLLYAGHGLIHLNNNSDLKEVAAYQLLLANQANIIYETGLANLLFDSGPGGGFTINSWAEVE